MSSRQGQSGCGYPTWPDDIFVWIGKSGSNDWGAIKTSSCLRTSRRSLSVSSHLASSLDAIGPRSSYLRLSYRSHKGSLQKVRAVWPVIGRYLYHVVTGHDRSTTPCIFRNLKSQRDFNFLSRVAPRSLEDSFDRKDTIFTKKHHPNALEPSLTLW